MDQQRLSALALIMIGALVAIGSSAAAIQRRQRTRAREPLWSRLLATLATAGLALGLMATGVSLYSLPYASPQSQPNWLALVATVGFACAIVSYAATITPAIWRMLWAD